MYDEKNKVYTKADELRNVSKSAQADAARMNERLNRLISRINGGYYIWAKKHGLQENKLNVLYALSDGKTHTQTEISRTFLIPKTTVNSVVKKLEEEGLIESGGSRKSRQICLSCKGKKYAFATLDTLFKAEHTAMEHLLKKYGEQFFTAYEEYAAVLEENLLN